MDRLRIWLMLHTRFYRTRWLGVWRPSCRKAIEAQMRRGSGLHIVRFPGVRR